LLRRLGSRDGGGRGRDGGGAPVTVGRARAFGIVGFCLTEGGVIAGRFFSGGAFLIGTRVHGADEEDDARRDAENAEQKQQRQTFRPGRENVQRARALCPGEIAPASAQRGAKQKLKNA
jgi:hypothetical protein